MARIAIHFSWIPAIFFSYTFHCLQVSLLFALLMQTSRLFTCIAHIRKFYIKPFTGIHVGVRINTFRSQHLEFTAPSSLYNLKRLDISRVTENDSIKALSRKKYPNSMAPCKFQFYHSSCGNIKSWNI